MYIQVAVEEIKEEQQEDEEIVDTNPQVSDMHLVPGRDQVFLHKDSNSGPWRLVRVADKQCVDLNYEDPVLNVMKIGGAYKVVIDSRSQAEGTRARYTNNVLRTAKRSKCSLKARRICFELLAHSYQMHSRAHLLFHKKLSNSLICQGFNRR